MNEERWYKLDNAAKIYPAVAGARISGVFRLSVCLTEEIDPVCLQAALEKTLPRFPIFAVSLRPGLFWYALTANPKSPLVTVEDAWPCSKIDARANNGFHFAVTHFGRKINLESFHSLADGTGAMAFLKTLLFHYLKERGCPVEADASLPTADGVPARREMEDSFLKYYDPSAKKVPLGERAFHLKGELLRGEAMQAIHGSLPVAALKAAARAKGVTVTEYLAALMGYSVYRSAFVPSFKELESRPIRISVPVNLRRFFKSDTLRNFSSFINVTMPTRGGGTSFDRFLEHTRENLRAELNEEMLLRKFSSNVAAEMNPFLKPVPLFLKNIAMGMAYHTQGDWYYTGTLSNLGPITLPPAMAPYVERFLFMIGANKYSPLNAGVSSFGDELTVSFTRILSESDIEEIFFRTLAEEGIPVTVRDNGAENRV